MFGVKTQGAVRTARRINTSERPSKETLHEARQHRRGAACLLAVGMAGMRPAAAQAQAATEDWKFEATVYGWFPAIASDMSFPTSGGPSIDVVYADLGGAKVGLRQVDGGRVPLPVDLTSNLSLDMKSWIWTVAGTCALAATPEYTISGMRWSA